MATNQEKIMEMTDLVDEYGALKEELKAFDAKVKQLKKLDGKICKLADELTPAADGDDFYGGTYELHVSCKKATSTWIEGALVRIWDEAGTDTFLDLITLSKKAACEVFPTKAVEGMLTTENTGKRTIKTVTKVVV